LVSGVHALQISAGTDCSLVYQRRADLDSLGRFEAAASTQRRALVYLIGRLIFSYDVDRIEVAVA